MKLDVKAFRYLGAEDWRVLTAVRSAAVVHDGRTANPLLMHRSRWAAKTMKSCPHP